MRSIFTVLTVAFMAVATTSCDLTAVPVLGEGTSATATNEAVVALAGTAMPLNFGGHHTVERRARTRVGPLGERRDQ